MHPLRHLYTLLAIVAFLAALPFMLATVICVTPTALLLCFCSELMEARAGHSSSPRHQTNHLMP